MTAWVQRPDWSAILDSYARCVRITRDKPGYTLLPDALTPAESQTLYKAVVDAEDSGTNFVASLAVFNIACPIDWTAGNIAADAAIADLYAGARIFPTGEDLARIEFYKGVTGLNEFVREYNNL